MAPAAEAAAGAAMGASTGYPIAFGARVAPSPAPLLYSYDPDEDARAAGAAPAAPEGSPSLPTLPQSASVGSGFSSDPSPRTTPLQQQQQWQVSLLETGCASAHHFRALLFAHCCRYPGQPTDGAHAFSSQDYRGDVDVGYGCDDYVAPTFSQRGGRSLAAAVRAPRRRPRIRSSQLSGADAELEFDGDVGLMESTFGRGGASARSLPAERPTAASSQPRVPLFRQRASSPPSRVPSRSPSISSRDGDCYGNDRTPSVSPPVSAPLQRQLSTASSIDSPVADVITGSGGRRVGDALPGTRKPTFVNTRVLQAKQHALAASTADFGAGGCAASQAVPVSALFSGLVVPQSQLQRGGRSRKPGVRKGTQPPPHPFTQPQLFTNVCAMHCSDRLCQHVRAASC